MIPWSTAAHDLNLCLYPQSNKGGRSWRWMNWFRWDEFEEAKTPLSRFQMRNGNSLFELSMRASYWIPTDQHFISIGNFPRIFLLVLLVLFMSRLRVSTFGVWGGRSFGAVMGRWSWIIPCHRPGWWSRNIIVPINGLSLILAFCSIVSLTHELFSIGFTLFPALLSPGSENPSPSRFDWAICTWVRVSRKNLFIDCSTHRRKIPWKLRIVAWKAFAPRPPYTGCYQVFLVHNR